MGKGPSVKTAKRAWLFDLPPAEIRSLRVLAVGGQAVGAEARSRSPSPSPAGSDSDGDSDDEDACGNNSSGSASSAGETERNTARNAGNAGNAGNEKNGKNGKNAVDAGTGSMGLSCAHCAASFEDLRSQRQHYRSKTHRFNLRRAGKGLPPVTDRQCRMASELSSADHYIRPAGDRATKGDTVVCLKRDPKTGENVFTEVESTDGGNGDSGDENEGGDDDWDLPPRDAVLTTDLRVFAALDDAEDTRRDAAVKTRSRPVVYFATGDGTRAIRVHKAAIADPREADERHMEDPASGVYAARIADAVLSRRTRVYLLVGAGHVAMAVTDGASVVAHKAFHRYVVRAKRGTRQATKDGAGKKPKSAGASIRRENERLLREETRAVLEAWRHHIESAGAIFISAPGSVNRSTVVYPGSPIVHGDPKVRHIPFATGRPTIAEVRLAHERLYKVTFMDPASIEPVVEAERIAAAERLAERLSIQQSATAIKSNGDGGGETSGDKEIDIKIHGASETEQGSSDNNNNNNNNNNPGFVSGVSKRSQSQSSQSQPRRPSRVPPPDSDLMRAIKAGDVPGVEAQLRLDPSCCDLDSAVMWTYTPLCLAARRGNAAICRVLLEHGADPRTPTDSCWTALHHAVSSGDPETITVVLEGGGDPESRAEDGRRPAEMCGNGTPAADALMKFASAHPSLWEWSSCGVTVIEEPLEIAHIEEMRRARDRRRAAKKKEKAKKRAKSKAEEDQLRAEELKREMMTPRERALAAAEARAAQMANASGMPSSTTGPVRPLGCAECGRLFAPSQVPFRKDGLAFCTTACVRARAMAIRAAGKGKA